MEHTLQSHCCDLLSWCGLLCCLGLDLSGAWCICMHTGTTYNYLGIIYGKGVWLSIGISSVKSMCDALYSGCSMQSAFLLHRFLYRCKYSRYTMRSSTVSNVGPPSTRTQPAYPASSRPHRLGIVETIILRGKNYCVYTTTPHCTFPTWPHNLGHHQLNTHASS